MPNPFSRRTTVAKPALLGSGWILPHWLHRQADPTSGAYVVGGADPTNITGRNWTILGAVGSAHVGGVDPRGLVVTRADSWSIDWWVKSENGWHFPSTASAVRQRSIEDSPVVQTAMSVPGGDIEHRAYAVGGANEAVAIEIQNATPVPVAVTIAIRPYGLTSQASVGRIELVDNTVVVDGEPALILPRRPGQVVGSNLRNGDCASALIEETDSDDLVRPMGCEAGLAQAAFSFPLVHSGVVRFVAPWPELRRNRIARVRAGRSVELLPDPMGIASSGNVASGWAAHVDRGARFVLPAGPISSTFERARRSLLLFQRGGDVHAQPLARPGLNWREAAPILGALDRMGWHAEAGEVIGSIPSRQATSGELVGRSGEVDGTSAALAATEYHIGLAGVPELAKTMAPTVARAAAFIDKQRRVKGERDELSAGLLPARDVGGHLEFRYADNFWALRGLLAAAAVLDTAGEQDAAGDVASMAADLRVDLLASLEGVAERFGDDALPATPHRAVDERAIDALVAVWPTGVLKPDHPMMRRTVDVLREHYLHGAAHHNTIGPRGLGTYRTARLGHVELLAGDQRVLDKVDWLVKAATPTGAWPRAIHPVLGTGTVGEGHHGLTTAHFVSLIRSMLVHEAPGDEAGLRILAAVPPEWLGQGIEVHKAPTAHGLLSYAVRWHGDRPALLWELDSNETHPSQVTISAPGFDPAWASTASSGETLLEVR